MSKESSELLKKKGELVQQYKEVNKLFQSEKVKYSGLQTQLESTKETLKGIERSIIQTNQAIKNFKDEAKREENVQGHEDDDTHSRMAMEAQVKEKLQELASKRLPLVSPSNPADTLEKLKEKTQDILYVHSVIIKLKSGSTVKQAAIRINTDTQFSELKDFASKHWVDEDIDSYVLCAHNYGVIEYLDEKVYKTILEQHLVPKFYLLLMYDLRSGKEAVNQTDFFGDEETRNMLDRDKEKKDKREIIDEKKKQENFESFRKRYEGMTAYMPKSSRITPNSEKKRISSWEVHICTLCMALIAAVLTQVVTLVYFVNTEDSYWISFQIRDTLTSEDAEGNSYGSISTILELQSFLEGPLAEVFYPIDDDSVPIISNYKTVGPLRFRVVKTKTKECSTEFFDKLEGVTCYEGDYNDDTKEKEDINGGGESWLVYQSADENDSPSTIFGEFSDYDGSGYVREFPIDGTFSYSDYTAGISELLQNDYFGLSTRALIITSSLYSHNSDYWVWLEILIENSVTGQLRPYNIVVRTFTPDLVSRSPGGLVLFTLRVLCMFYFLALYTYTAYRSNKKKLWDKFKELPHFKVAYDLFIVILMFTEIGIFITLDIDEKQTMDDNDYYDFHDASVLYRTLYIINNWIFFMLLLKFLQTLKIFRRIYLLLVNIEIASKDILKYMLLLSPLLLGFCCISLSVWGPYYTNYRNFSYALLNNLLFSIGVGNPSVLSKLNLFWTIMFYMIYLFFVVFFILSAFIGIFMDAYRQMRVNEGYRDDVMEANYLSWLFGFIPKKTRTAIREKFKKKKE